MSIKVKLTLLSAFAATVLSALSPAPMAAQDNVPTDIADLLFYTPTYANDTEREAQQTCDSLLRRAIDIFSQVQTLKAQTDPAAAGVFQAILRATNAAQDVLEVAAPHSVQMVSAREMLRSLNPDLESGAFHYSNAGVSDSLKLFARKYIDVQLLPVFADHKFERNPKAFPTLAYIAASGAYNESDFPAAIKYFREYFTTPDTVLRERVYMYMGQACLAAPDYDLGVQMMADGARLYPNNAEILRMGLRACIDGSHAEMIDRFLDPALAADPTNEKLLQIKGKILEDRGQYAEAVKLYNTLAESNPGSLNIAKRLSLAYYNLAVSHFNRAINEKSEKDAAKARRMAREYFAAAMLHLDNVTASDPLNIKYLKAAAVASLCLEDRDKFDSLNSRIVALGADPLSEAFLPAVVTYSDDGAPNIGQSGQAVAVSGAVPRYSDFGGQYVTSHLKEFVTKDEFETVEAYKARVNDRTIAAEMKRLKEQAAQIYLREYGKALAPSDMQLMPYDADNQTFLIHTDYGDISLAVPLADGRARTFKQNWTVIRPRGAEYYIADDAVRIKKITFDSPDGHSYTYDNSREAAYSEPVINIDLATIIEQPSAPAASDSGNRKHTVTIAALADVDENIPVAKRPAPRTFALVMANENYRGGIENVRSALHDGEVMTEYLANTLGLPRENIFYYPDATLADMIRGIDRLSQAVKAHGEDVDVIFYYAGHGMPDEETHDAYLLPVDGSPTLARINYKLSDVYQALSQTGARSVVALIDACFSGSKRGDGMLAQARSVALKPTDEAAVGNMMILTATSDKQTAMPYTEKNHGMFTYFILKKLQQTGGNVTLKELAEYVRDNVSKQSVLVNSKPQTPSWSLSGNMNAEWSRRKLKP